MVLSKRSGACALAVACGLIAACAHAPPQPQEFSGVYFENFEINGFRDDASGETWWAVVSPEARRALADATPEWAASVRPEHGSQWRIAFEGMLSRVGRFGHLGSFERSVFIGRLESVRWDGPPPRCEPAATIVFFGDGEAEGFAETGTGLALLDEVMEPASRCDVEAVELVGHTDSRGSEAANVALSRRRADVVRDLLVARGAPAGVITIIARGEAEPLRETADGADEAMNRRVEVSIAFGQRR